MSPRFFQHEHAIVESRSIGDGARICAFSHILPGARIGRDCNVCDHTFIENDVVIGDRVTIQCGVHLWDGIRVEDGVFIGANASFAKSSTAAPGTLENTVLKQRASIGANATILPGIVIGERAVVSAGAVVTRNVPPDAIVSGNPASIVGYVGIPVKAPLAEFNDAADVSETEVRGVRLYSLPKVEDLRGSLTFVEAPAQIPFEVRRLFWTYEISSLEVRGEHAHKTLHQFLICVNGSCSVVVDDGANRREFRLDSPWRGLYLPPMIWSVQYKHSKDAILLALASAPYDPNDYIREYSEFLRLLSNRA